MVGSTPVLQPSEHPCASLIAVYCVLYRDLATLEIRKRSRREADEQAYRCTLLALTAAIAMIALMRIPPEQGLPISFGDHSYIASRISVAALRTIRDGLQKAGYIVVKPGFNDREGRGRSKVTRLHPTTRFTALARAEGLTLRALIHPPEPPYVLRDPSRKRSRLLTTWFVEARSSGD
jgi:hypothetical protein